MAQTGPDTPGESWQEEQGTCGECGLTFGIGKMVKAGESVPVTDPCPNPLCDGSATVTLKG
jgi:hypothetical protein